MQDVVFEWPCPIPEDIETAEMKCRKWLDQCFTEYTIESFYLLGKEVTKEK